MHVWSDIWSAYFIHTSRMFSYLVKIRAKPAVNVHFGGLFCDYAVISRCSITELSNVLISVNEQCVHSLAGAQISFSPKFKC